MRILILGAFCLLVSGAASAEHEADHRYQVRGFVLDADENALADREVVVANGGAVLASERTDSSGYYSLHLHLHNEDLGRVLQLRAGNARGEIRVTFDPQDRSTARIHEANFIGGELVEGSLGRWRTPTWLYVVVAFVALGATLVMLENRRRRKLRHSHPQHAVQAAAPARKRRKKRRHKR